MKNMLWMKHVYGISGLLMVTISELGRYTMTIREFKEKWSKRDPGQRRTHLVEFCKNGTNWILLCILYIIFFCKDIIFRIKTMYFTIYIIFFYFIFLRQSFICFLYFMKNSIFISLFLSG